MFSIFNILKICKTDFFRFPTENLSDLDNGHPDNLYSTFITYLDYKGLLFIELHLGVPVVCMCPILIIYNKTVCYDI